MKQIFLILVSICSFNAVGQTITVFDKTSLQPLENVSIKTQQHNEFTSTNSYGKAALSTASSGDTLSIERLGYYPQKVAFQGIDLKVFLSQKSHELNEVVISVTKFEERKSMVPQQVQVLKAKDLAFLNQPTTAEVMQQTGNVLVQKSQLGGGSPIIRGFEANKVLLVVDGVRMNNAIYRGGHLQNILSMDNSILERAEIVFGPGSTVYGSDALGGVIHFYTKDPSLAKEEKTKIGGNSFLRYSSAANEKTGHFDFNIGFKKIGFLSSVTYSDFEDLRQGNIRSNNYDDWGKRKYYYRRINNKDSAVVNKDINIQRGSAYQQVDVLQKVLFKQSDNLNHILNFQYSQTSNVPRYDRLSELTSDGELKFAEWYYGPQTRLLTSYVLNHTSDNVLYNDLRLTAAYQNIGESRNDRRFGKDILRSRIERLDIGSINLDLSKNIRNHEFRYGLEYAYNRVNSIGHSEDITTREISPLDTRYPDGGSDFRTMAGFVSHTWKINPKLLITDGVRYSSIYLNSRFNDTTFFNFPFREVTQKSSAISGSLGTVFKPNPATQLSLLASTGFRAPNVDDMAKVFESIPGSIIVPNPDLKPEYTYNLEFNADKTFFDKVQLGGGVYYTLYDNAITVKSFNYQGKDTIEYEGKRSRVTANVNASNAFIYGYHLHLSADVNSTFTITSHLNFTRGRIKTDSTLYPLDHIPPVFGKTSVYLNRKKLKGEFFVMYNGWKRLKEYNVVGEDNLQYATKEGTPSWYTLNLRAAYQINQYLQIVSSFENILDRNYRVFGSGISAAGRNISLTLRGRF